MCAPPAAHLGGGSVNSRAGTSSLGTKGQSRLSQPKQALKQKAKDTGSWKLGHKLRLTLQGQGLLGRALMSSGTSPQCYE